jgi:acetyl-CoA carboxylase biotin carboxyl carrier protein
MSKITQRDIESIVQLFETGDWNALELRFGVTDLFLSKRPDDRPSWSKLGPETPRDAPAAAPSAVSPPSKALSPEPASEPITHRSAQKTPAIDMLSGHVVVAAPSLGTFYRAPKPGAASFVEIGQAVVPETELCLVEVMKLFTTLRAGMTGIVRQILVSDGEMIETGQPLFVIEPNG